MVPKVLSKLEKKLINKSTKIFSEFDLIVYRQAALKFLQLILQSITVKLTRRIPVYPVLFVVSLIDVKVVVVDDHHSGYFLCFALGFPLRSAECRLEWIVECRQQFVECRLDWIDYHFRLEVPYYLVELNA